MNNNNNNIILKDSLESSHHREFRNTKHVARSIIHNLHVPVEFDTWSYHFILLVQLGTLAKESTSFCIRGSFVIS